MSLTPLLSAVFWLQAGGCYCKAAISAFVTQVEEFASKEPD